MLIVGEDGSIIDNPHRAASPMVYDGKVQPMTCQGLKTKLTS
jgi:hypothetical protein